MVLDRSMRWPVAPHPDPHSSHKTPSRVGIFALNRCGEGKTWMSVHALCERGERRIDASHMRMDERVAVCNSWAGGRGGAGRAGGAGWGGGVRDGWWGW